MSASSCTAGDFNGDGWPDLAFANGDPQPGVYIYLSEKGTFSAENRLEIPGGNPGVVRAGDINGDGWLDLIFPGGVNIDTLNYHSPSQIYWGGETGYSDNRRSELEAYTSFEISVHDLNSDGYPEIIITNHIEHGDHTIFSSI